MNGSVRRESVSRSSVFAFQQKVIKVNRKSFTQTDIYVSLSGIYDIHSSDNDHDGESSCLIILNSSSLTQKHQTEKQTLIAKSLNTVIASNWAVAACQGKAHETFLHPYFQFG